MSYCGSLVPCCAILSAFVKPLIPSRSAARAHPARVSSASVGVLCRYTISSLFPVLWCPHIPPISVLNLHRRKGWYRLRIFCLQIQRMVISGGNFKPDTLKPKEVVSLLLDDEELELKCKEKTSHLSIVFCFFLRSRLNIANLLQIAREPRREKWSTKIDWTFARKRSVSANSTDCH